jgi:alkylation response protein AidB-like acyl-CoA dehydrogenase
VLRHWVVPKWPLATVEYAKTREQFKTAIANFGAIKHKLAEMAMQDMGE